MLGLRNNVVTGYRRRFDYRTIAAKIETITRTAFTTGLNRILLVAAIIALVSGVISLAAIRGKDFAASRGPGSVA